MKNCLVGWVFLFIASASFSSEEVISIMERPHSNFDKMITSHVSLNNAPAEAFSTAMYSLLQTAMRITMSFPAPVVSIPLGPMDQDSCSLMESINDKVFVLPSGSSRSDRQINKKTAMFSAWPLCVRLLC